MVIPMKGQYEQHFNAEGLKHLGVPVLDKLSKKSIKNIQEWVIKGEIIPKHFPDQTQVIIDGLLMTYIESIVRSLSNVQVSPVNQLSHFN